jgi:hypothetical protein
MMIPQSLSRAEATLVSRVRVDAPQTKRRTLEHPPLEIRKLNVEAAVPNRYSTD